MLVTKPHSPGSPRAGARRATDVAACSTVGAFDLGDARGDPVVGLAATMKRPPTEATLHSRARAAFNHSRTAAEIRTAPRSVVSKLGHAQERIRPLAHHHRNNNTPCNCDGVSSGPQASHPGNGPGLSPRSGLFLFGGTAVGSPPQQERNLSIAGKSRHLQREHGP